MLIKVINWAVIGGMILIGLLFGSNIYVLGDTASAIQMHDDLPSTATPLMVNMKVIITFITGMLFLIAAVAIISKNHNLSIAGTFGFALFDGFYLLELAMWANIHPRIWIYFAIVGGIVLLFGTFCWRYWIAGRTQTIRALA
ncbi:Uncharacterised protein [uncultured archaeon]|nr:Uncharacterised protein [uncultured archaeon]